MDVVCLSVCPVSDAKSRMEGHSKLQIGRMDAHDTDNPWLQLEVKRSKVKVTWRINALTDNQPYLRNEKCYTNVKLSIWMKHEHAQCSSSWSSHHLHGAGHIVGRAYCGDRITDCRACFRLDFAYSCCFSSVVVCQSFYLILYSTLFHLKPMDISWN